MTPPPPPAARPPVRAGRRLLAAVLLLPLAELVVAIQVGRRFGALPTILALVVVSAVGVGVLVLQGRGWMQALQRSAVTGRPPQLGADGAGMAVRAGAGLLLALPGFVSGLAGALLLLPPVAAAIRRLAARRAARAGVGRPGGRGAAGRVVITGELIDQPEVDRPEVDPSKVDPPGLGPGGSTS